MLNSLRVYYPPYQCNIIVSQCTHVTQSDRTLYNTYYNRHYTKSGKRETGALTTDEIISARNKWIKRLPKDDQQDLRSSEWKLVEDRQAGILRCEG